MHQIHLYVKIKTKHTHKKTNKQNKQEEKEFESALSNKIAILHNQIYTKELLSLS